ncbi:interferon-inducible double-stranded RNA-dependent protein kinase activator A homolog isoform X1 [Cloeon dipterum]|uniref:interferon-inducible double-stranded RNA-dependent protein kinase activator A homolog isoform X1 n=1 Tax=Cloeon dipterum TaxID=197152 RepID=UPI0032209A1B
MAAKTPVSRLQEISTKLRISPPEYELIYSKLEGLSSYFTFNCKFHGRSAEGSGRNKRDAKHEAADALLRLLETDENTRQNLLDIVPCPVVLPHGNKVQRNFVGDLKEYCLEILRSSEKPEFEERGAFGPSHDPTFTVRCTISNFSAEGMGPTKKQAKQLAAKQVLERLLSLRDHEREFVEPEEQAVQYDESDMSEEEKLTVQKYYSAYKVSLPKLENINKSNEIFKKFHYRDKPALRNYHVDKHSKEGWDAYSTLQEVCKGLGEDDEDVKTYFCKFKPKVSPSDISSSSLDDSSSSEPSVSGEKQKSLFSCMLVAHVRPIDLICTGSGETVEACVQNASEEMLYLLYCFMYDHSPFEVEE